MAYGDIGSLDREQKKVIKEIIRGGRRYMRNSSPRERRKAINTALAVGYTESRYRNLPGGDRDSQGWRQERAMYYDDPRNLKASVKRFYDEYKADASPTSNLGDRAQAVQQSGTPDVWDSLAPMANTIRKKFGGSAGRPNQTGRPGRTNNSSVSGSLRIPGVNNSALRQQLLQQYVLNPHDPNALLGLAQGLEGAQDVPGTIVPGRELEFRGRGRGKDVVTATGQSVNQMLKKAEKWDKAKAPYLWGGGHGSIAKPGQPVDCSGYVSAVLGLDTPQVSGNLAAWGKPGQGKWVSVYANDGHVLMSIRDPKSKKVRWFGTSRSNPGGGAGEISPPDQGYLSNFTVRHP